MYIDKVVLLYHIKGVYSCGILELQKHQNIYERYSKHLESNAEINNASNRRNKLPKK